MTKAIILVSLAIALIIILEIVQYIIVGETGIKLLKG